MIQHCSSYQPKVDIYYLDQVCWVIFGIMVRHKADPRDSFRDFKMQQRSPFVMEIIILICWNIWTSCNDQIFRGIESTVSRGKDIFKEFALSLKQSKDTSCY